MNIPKTSRTIISQLVDSDKIELWNGAWRRFFDIYHAPIKIMVAKEFNKHGWYDIPNQVIDEVISDVVISLNETFLKGKYEKGRGSFRFLLKRISMCRAMDYMRKNYKHLTTKSIDMDDASAVEAGDMGEGDFQSLFESDEIQALKHAMILDAYETIRSDFSPRTCLAFEMVKLEQIPVDEVVKELGIDANSVNNSVYRIMKKLKSVIYNDENTKELYDEK